MPLTEPPIPQIGRWLTVNEFSALYSIDRSNVRRAARKGLITAIRPVGGHHLSLLDPGWVAVLAMFDDPRHLWYMHVLKWQEAMRLLGIRHRSGFSALIKKHGIKSQLGENGVGQYYALIDIIRLVRKRDAARYGHNYGKPVVNKFSPTITKWALDELRTLFPSCPLTAEERQQVRKPPTKRQALAWDRAAERLRRQGRAANPPKAKLPEQPAE